MQKLLIQSCSATKHQTPGLVPAFDRYDGVNFRVLKKFRREQPALFAQLRIVIVSAQFGLIAADEPIPDYDLKMSPPIALQQQSENLAKWLKLSENFAPHAILVNAGHTYLPALRLIDFPASTEYTSGGIGLRLGQLKRWLLRPVRR